MDSDEKWEEPIGLGDAIAIGPEYASSYRYIDDGGWFLLDDRLQPAAAGSIVRIQDNANRGTSSALCEELSRVVELGVVIFRWHFERVDGAVIGCGVLALNVNMATGCPGRIKKTSGHIRAKRFTRYFHLDFIFKTTSSSDRDPMFWDAPMGSVRTSRLCTISPRSGRSTFAKTMNQGLLLL